jgi:hypothetical protein
VGAAILRQAAAEAATLRQAAVEAEVAAHHQVAVVQVDQVAPVAPEAEGQIIPDANLLTTLSLQLA